MRDHAPELGRVALDFDEGAAKLVGFGALCQGFLQQPTESVLLALNPEDVLHFLASTRAWNLGVQEHASHDLVAGESARARQAVKVGPMRVAEPHRDSMLELPHLRSIRIGIGLSRDN